MFALNLLLSAWQKRQMCKFSFREATEVSTRPPYMTYYKFNSFNDFQCLRRTPKHSFLVCILSIKMWNRNGVTFFFLPMVLFSPLGFWKCSSIDIKVSFTSSSSALPGDPFTPAVSHGYLNSSSHHRGDPARRSLPAGIGPVSESTNNTLLSLCLIE